MKERPILCNADEVRAILDGRQTQIRRVVKSHPLIDCGMSDSYIINPDNYVIDDCPFGKTGDLLWVREPIYCSLQPEGRRYVKYAADGNFTADIRKWLWNRLYLPSVAMPRWASRITLEITGVRVERLQDISISERRANGALPSHEASLLWRETLSMNFVSLWNLNNDKRGYSWKSNPWVWVIEFRRVMTDRETE